MRVIENTSPTVRVISSLAPERSPEGIQISSASAGRPLFYSNSRIILGIMLAALSLLLFTFAYSRFHPQKSGAATMAPELVAIKAPKQRPPPPLPEEELEPLELSMVHVTAISLGEPALALVNGDQLAEGDQFTLPSKSGPDINLTVVRITDGKVEFTDGKQKASAFLEVVVVAPKTGK